MKKVFTFVAAALCAVAMSATSLYSVDFTKGQGSWTINNKDISGLGYVWQQTDQYGMKASAYVKQAFAAESWLVSPAIDLTKATSATLTINQALNKGAATNLAVKVSSDDGANWDNLSISFPEGSSWNYQEDNANLNAYVGKTIKLAFAYVSTTSVCPTWQIKSVAIAGEGEGGEGEGGEGEGGEGGEGGEIVVTGLNYVDAVFYEDETYGDYWSFDFYNDLDEEGYIVSPYVYFICDESTTSSTKIAGTWNAYDAGYYETDEEESGVYTDEEEPVGSLTVTCVGEGLYNFAGSFVGDDGKTYKWNLKNMEVYAYNGDTYEDISLDDYQPTAVENTEANVQSAIKTLRNGQVLIRKNNKTYTILGQEVK